MSYGQGEDNSHVLEEDAQLFLESWPLNELPPTIPGRQHDQAERYSEVSPSLDLHRSADDLHNQRDIWQRSPYDGQTSQQSPSDDSLDQSQDLTHVADNAPGYYQSPLQPLLPDFADQNPQQEETSYFEHDHRQQPHQWNSSTAEYLSGEVDYDFLSFQSTSSDPAYFHSSVQQGLSTFCNSPIGNRPSQYPQYLRPPQEHWSHSTALYYANLRAVNGVMIPSTRAPGELPLQPNRPETSGDQPLDCFCSICGAGFAYNGQVQAHFAACVGRNGNPNAARWNDRLNTPGSGNWDRMAKKYPNIVPAPLRNRILDNSAFQALYAQPDQISEPSNIMPPNIPDFNPNEPALQALYASPSPATGPSNIIPPNLPDFNPDESAFQTPYAPPKPKKVKRSEAIRENRTKIMKERLDAVNGVVIPSKLPEGQAPTEHDSKANENTPLPFLCPRCKGAFRKKDHVRDHFATCVDRNGNPEGKRWDDGLPVFKRGSKASGNQNQGPQG